MAEIITKCAYCGKEFTGKNRKATYCCNSCRVMASRKRIREENEEYFRHKTKLEREYELLRRAQDKLDREKVAFERQKAIFEQREAEFNQLFNKYWPQILMLHDLKIENKFYKEQMEKYRKEYFKNV